MVVPAEDEQEVQMDVLQRSSLVVKFQSTSDTYQGLM